MFAKRLSLSILLLCLSVTFFWGCGKEEEKTSGKTRAVDETKLKTTGQPSMAGKKVLVINSYHKGYAWSDDVETGISGVFKEHPEIEFEFHRMDTKRNTSEASKKTAATKARDLIESWKPDVVIASDDNASKYLVVPYYNNADLPIIFCGVNWDATPYGYPFKNVTGMVEIALMDELVKTLRAYAKGNRVGLLGPDVTSARQDANYYKGITGIEFTEERYVEDFSEWKSAYLQLQKTVDILIVPAWQGTKGWDEKEAMDFILTHTRIPSGAEVPFMAKYVLASFAKDPFEQGEWAANTALEILRGKKTEEIPIATNKKAKVILNMKLAKKLGVKFPMELVERATFVEEEGF